MFPREIWKHGGRVNDLKERWPGGKTWNNPTKMLSLSLRRRMRLVLSSCR